MINFSLDHLRSHQNLRRKIAFESGKPDDQGIG